MRGVAAIVAAVMAMAGLGAVSGCASGSPPPNITQEKYAGPEFSVEQSGGGHVLVMHAPGAGWRLHLDRLYEGFHYQGVYVSVTPPNPAFSYPLTPVEQRLATNVRDAESLKAYARLLRFTGEFEVGDPYSPVAEAAGKGQKAGGAGGK